LLFHKIAAGARTRFTSAHQRRSARTGRRPRKFIHSSSKSCPLPIHADERPLRALRREASPPGGRANRVFGTEVKRVLTKNTVMVKSADGFSSAQ
ncbi:MAG: hypothetical protein AAB150_16120, partial [Pseudomonadota bacterium]